MSKGCMIIKKRYKILDTVSMMSRTMTDYINKHETSNFTMYYKIITHSDVPCGKNIKTRSEKKKERIKQLDKNILYYNTSEQMYNIEKKKKKIFPCAHQSSITFSNELYEQLGISIIKRREGKQTTNHYHPNLSDYANVRIVKDTLTYFTADYTEKIIHKLGRKISWKKDSYTYNLSSDDNFIKIDLHYTVHGLCDKQDSLMSKIRHNLFVGDLFSIIVEENKNRKNVFLLFAKNKRFYELMGIKDEIWLSYIESQKQKEESNGRSGQGAWRNALAAEIATYNIKSDKVFCPITNIFCDYEKLGTLFRASHILQFKECNKDQKYDLNNGLFLSVTADALFDKYYISIDSNKKLQYSKYISQDLRSKLLLDNYDQQVLNDILNEERMMYMKQHYKKFLIKEKQRGERK